MAEVRIIPHVFQEFPKIPRWSRRIIVTEKIDGTNTCVLVTDDGAIQAGSRTRWIQPTKTEDHYGFARWVEAHKTELLELGPGLHHGEWWGQGVNRGYGLQEKRWSLLNTSKWSDKLPGTENQLKRPICCNVVPVLYDGEMNQTEILFALETLRVHGSVAAPGFMDPEGVVIYHVQGNLFFKKTLKNDETPKSVTEAKELG